MLPTAAQRISTRSAPACVTQPRVARYKVLFLFLAGLNALIYHSTIHRKVWDWDREPIPPRSARLAGFFSLALWALVIAAGRTTAYKM